MHLTAGTRLGAYEIVAPLGSGGMGEVYRAHDVRVDRDVAIKVLPQRLARDEEARARLAREAKAVAQISHPNVLALYEFEQEGDFAYVVTELLEGETLRTIFTRGPMSWRRAAEIGAAIADGLSAAHAKGIVHRDLKPENIFVTSDGRVKILDFGLARNRPNTPIDESQPTVRLHSDELDSDTNVIGTVGYMSPEQLRAEHSTPATDLFALGCILYEAVTGRGAFRANTAIDTMTAVLRDEMPSLTESGERIPYELDRIVHRCVEKSPAARFQSAGDLAFALRSIGTGDHPVAPRVPARRNVGWWIAGAIALAVVIAGLIVARSRIAARNAPIRSLAVLPFANGTNDPANEYLSDGITESLINNLSRVPNLSVVSSASVFYYKKRFVPVQTAARELKVQAVLTGRIVRSAEELIISTELIDGKTNRHLWGRQSRTRLEDLSTAQAAISREIADQLRIELTGAARANVARRHTQSGEAYRAYLHGRYELNKRTGDAFVRAIRHFRDAIAHDPDYALAYAGLADCYILQSIYNEARPSTALPLAGDAAARALDIDDTLAEAHTSLAYFKMNFGSDLNAAAEEFERAIELNPSYATAHQWYSRCLVEMKRYDEAIREIRRAEALDPLSLVIIAELGGVYSDAGRLDEAVAECKRALALEPGFAFGHYVLAGAYLKQQRYDDAIREATIAWNRGSDPRSLVRVGLSQVAAGRRDEATRTLETLEKLSEKRFVSSYSLATLLIALGRTDEARERLNKASQELPPGQYQRLVDALPLRP